MGRIRERGGDYQRAREIFLGDKYVCHLDCGEVLSVNTCRMFHVVHFKPGLFILSQSYLNKQLIPLNFVGFRSRPLLSDPVTMPWS